MNIDKKFDEKLFEDLAAIEHERWADWQRYLHNQCNFNENRAHWYIPMNLFARWERQIETDYEDLTEKEKDSDRKQVRRYDELIKKFIHEIIEEIKDECV